MNDLIVLVALLPGPAHGYAIKKSWDLALEQDGLHNNVVYPLLRKFMKKRWVTQTTAAGARGGLKKLYRLTPAGRAELSRRIEEFDDKTAGREDAFLLRVALFPFLSRGACERILDLRGAFVASRITRLRMLERERVREGFAAETLHYVLQQHEAERRWIKKIRQGHERLLRGARKNAGRGKQSASPSPGGISVDRKKEQK
jgi:DNA-binding PadR family transcriptional regulator